MVNKEPHYITQTKDYIKMLSQLIKQIEKAKPKDRMEYAVAVAKCLNSALVSIKGWGTWINDLERLNALTIEDFKTVYPKIRKSIIQFLKVDIEITKKKLVEASLKRKKKQRKKEEVKPKETYIS